MTTSIHPGTFQVKIPAEQVVLTGELALPEHPHGVVLFVNAHGAGATGRTRLLAADLNRAGLATLLFDLRSHEERQRLVGPHDIATLTDRLLSVTEWVGLEPDTCDLQQGYLATGSGSAPALVAAARAGHKVHAVVCRGGRPDLARDWLSEVVAPTLLIVGAEDLTLRTANEEARRLLRCPTRLTVIPGAGRDLEEAGSLQLVSREALAWFDEYLHAGWTVGR